MAALISAAGNGKVTAQPRCGDEPGQRPPTPRTAPPCVNGPSFAHAILTTAELLALLRKWRQANNIEGKKTRVGMERSFRHERDTAGGNLLRGGGLRRTG